MTNAVLIEINDGAGHLPQCAAMPSSEIIRTARDLMAEHGAFAVKLAESQARIHRMDHEPEEAALWMRIAFTVRTMERSWRLAA
jgi:hypothetical protein